jgi:hypothetical protein|uniref:Uncharacterized protein n=1 Tax=viral metagenome TaxID=1070528 RepID=A0A6C0JZ24_9ZZZZ
MSETNQIELKVNIESPGGPNYDIRIENIKFQKMLFLFNAINDGWSIKKRKESYIFTKNHEGKKEILLDTYLLSFMKGNFDVNKILT